MIEENVFLFRRRIRAAGEAGAEERGREVHSVRITRRSRGVRESAEAVLRAGVALAGKGAGHALQRLQSLLPSAALSAAAGEGGGAEVWVLRSGGGSGVQVLPLLWIGPVNRNFTVIISYAQRVFACLIWGNWKRR